MAQAGVIRDFMVALGFTTDKSKAEEMKKALLDVETRTKILHKALLGLAVGATFAVTKTASELDKLYFSSQRIGASATNITAFGNAISQMGGDAESAIGTLENLAEKLRNSPGYESQIKGLGVDTRKANGEMRDRVDVMKDLSGVLAKMPAYQANAYANSLGIDQNTLLAMRDGKFVSNMEKYQKIQQELGMNDELTKSGNDFMTEYRDLTMVTKTGFQVIVMQAGKALIPILRLLNQLVRSGISAFSQLHPAIKGVLSAGLQLVMFALVLRGLVTAFGMLKVGLGVIKMFIPALKLFRLAFLASPIGIILALASALALLWDDYKTWKEGGKSLFDWSKWTNGIEKIIGKIKDFLAMLDKIKDKVINFVQKIISDPVAAVKEVAEATKEALANAGDEIANPAPDEHGNVTEPKNAIATGVDKAFSLADKGLAVLGNKDAQQRVDQRGRGEIGYKPQPKVETPKNSKDLAKFAENAEQPTVLGKLSNDVKGITQKGVEAIVGVTKFAQGVVIGVAKQPLGDSVSGLKGGTLHLSKQDIEDLVKVTSTEVVGSLKGEAFTKQTHGVVDTILNRVASGKWGDSVRDVANAHRQFSKITGPKSYKTKDGRKINLNPYGTVQNMPNKDVNPRVKAEVLAYLEQRSKGKKSIVGEHLNYANPYSSDTKNRKAWVDAFYAKSKKDGMVFGAGKAVHGHGTTKELIKSKPKPFNVSIRDEIGVGSVSAPSSNKVKSIQSYSPPSGNPHKTQTNNSSNMTASNVTIHQEFKTDMTLNGVASPIESANAVKRQQENQLAIMARGAKGVLV